MRYYIIDDLRALAIIDMIIYHALFDLVYSFGVDIPWFMGKGAFIWEQYICWSFILIAGFCQYFAKGSLKEGLTVSFWGLVITIVMLLWGNGLYIFFGVLTFIGAAILVTIPLKKLLKRLNPVLGIVLCFGLFLLFRNINYGYLGFGEFNLITLPDWLYPDKSGWIRAFIGLTPRYFSSADYFSFIPWYFLFLTGFYIYGALKKYNKLYLLRGKRIPVLEWISSHSLLIYVLHQPIVFVILMIFTLLN